nr:venom peptide isomerase heavy chain-like [Lepeophtheirus salmonis]
MDIFLYLCVTVIIFAQVDLVYGIDSDTNCVNPGALLNGCTSTKERILGGRRVNEGEIPWQVMFRLRVQDLFLSTCGGTIISNQFVLTAAHCFIYPIGVNTSTNTRLNESYIMAGSTKFNSGEKHTIKKLIVHPEYNWSVGFLLKNDIAIVQVSNPFVFGENVMALCLPKVGLSIPEGSTLIVSGWGVTRLHPSYKTFPYFSETNMRTELKTLSMESEKCEYSKNYPVSPNSKMCTYNPPNDSCIGDSGSPLTMAIDGQCILVGIVSEGKDCGSDQYGALSVNVSYYTTWILKQIKDFCEFHDNLKL